MVYHSSVLQVLQKNFARMFVPAAKSFKASMAKVSSTKKAWYTSYSIEMTAVTILCKVQVDLFLSQSPFFIGIEHFVVEL